MIRKQIFAIIAGVLVATSGWAAVTLKLPQPQVETLANGLQLVWFVDERIPVVDLVLLVRSGERDDPPGKSGVSSLLSAALGRDSGGISATEMSRSVEKLGASRSISTDDEAFLIGTHGLAADSEELLKILALTALKPDFLDTEVKREHGRILDRWRHLGDSAEVLASVAFQKRIMAGTHYGRTGFASVKEFTQVAREDVLAYYKAHFTPKNSILMIVGQVNKPQFRMKIEKAFQDWKGEIPQRQWKNYSDPRVMTQPGQILLLDRPDLTQAQVRIGLPAPDVHSPDRYDLAVGNALFGEYFNSRLVSVIRDEMGLTYGIGSGFSFNQEVGRFSILTSTRTESVGKLLDETLFQLKKWKNGPIPAQEVETAREYLSGGFPLGVASLGAVASRWLAARVMGLGDHALDEFAAKINSVTPERVNQAVKKHIQPDQAMIVIAGDAVGIRKSLEKSGFTKIKLLKAGDLN